MKPFRLHNSSRAALQATLVLVASLVLPAFAAAQRAPHHATARRAPQHVPAPRSPTARPLGDTARTLLLLQRATFGVRPADLEAALRLGRERWLDRQLHPETIDDAALDERLAAYPAAAMDVAELYRQFPPPAALKRQQRMAGDTARPVVPAANRPARMVADFVSARLARDVYSERQLQEVMTDFWFNHFNVFIGKGPDRYLVAKYEREAIRPYVFGRFEDMLKATASHPAMLVYLDNWMSASPDTTSPQYVRRREQLRRFASLTPDQQQALVDQGRMTADQLQRLRIAVAGAGARKPGINENYARELMELHTLGVDGGYTQQDVIAVARAFTGWTITRPRIGPNAPPSAAVEFVFRPELHDRAEKVVLGTPLRPGRGVEDGLDVLHMLATSPATAHHVARQLVERFVSDRPDSAMVERIARVFLDSDGDLRAVTRALFTDPGFYDRMNVDAKVRTPLELVVAAVRVSGADMAPAPSRALIQTLRTLGELPYAYSFPTGYPAAAAEWVNSGAMLNRMNFALALAAGRIDHVRVNPAALLADRVAGVAPQARPARDEAAGVAPEAASVGDAVAGLCAALLPGRDTRALQATVRADLARQPALPREEGLARAAGLILASPDFQRR